MTCQLLFLGSPLLLVAPVQGFCIKHNLLRRLKKPLDLNLRFRGRRLFGNNKTWRGLILNVSFCALGAVIQTRLQVSGVLPDWLYLADYSQHGLSLGILIGLGITFGELTNSFMKRQLDIAPGKKAKDFWGIFFLIIDQIDLTLGLWLFSFHLIDPTLLLVIWSLLLTIVIHITVSILGYLLGMRESAI